jgi:hypothetical protein
MNKHLLPSQVDDKRKEPELMPCLKALVKRVTELRQAGLRACHFVEEFIILRIHPLGRREKLAFEFPRLADPNRDPLATKILTSLFFVLRLC